MSKYLSNAFSRRSDSEIELLRGFDGRTGFSLFWLDCTRPLLEHIQAKKILEIGADQGQHTQHLLDFCRKQGASLTIIDPVVSPVLKKTIAGNSRATLLAQPSAQAIPTLPTSFDAALIEGDLNYASVLSDLNNIAALARRYNQPLPLIFLSALSWPYARRDMYYDPPQLPATARHLYERRGMIPWEKSLVNSGINQPFANAALEGGQRNGVLTAVEDFIANATTPLKLFRLPLNHGYGIIYSPGSAAATWIDANLKVPPQLFRLLESVELARLNEVIRRIPFPAASVAKRLANWLRYLSQ